MVDPHVLFAIMARPGNNMERTEVAIRTDPKPCVDCDEPATHMQLRRNTERNGPLYVNVNVCKEHIR